MHVVGFLAGRHILGNGNETKASCGELGGTFLEPLEAACFCRRQVSSTNIPDAAPVLEYSPAEGGNIRKSSTVTAAAEDACCQH